MRDSNTSHVTINLISTLYRINVLMIQIHLMLLLIDTVGSETDIRVGIQIHLMLLLIEIFVEIAKPFQLFKYISCYY